MATRSRISVKTNDNKIHSIYCHWDGYPSHHYSILSEYYNTQELAEELVKNGYMSVLDKYCTKPENHSFENPQKDYCVYYHRDRGEDINFCQTNIYDKISDIPYEVLEEFNYYWNGAEWIIYLDNGDIIEYDAETDEITRTEDNMY